jgi:DnaJ-class molecular chaperone
MDIFKMATQIANSMSDEDKSAIENMDMEKMIQHVTKNVFKVMNVSAEPESTPGHLDLLPRTRDICFDLNVDLVDFYNSKKKKLNIKRKRIIEIDGKQKIIEEKKKITVFIEKGMKDEQQIRFEGEADQIPGYTPGDIIITLIENEHPVFQRENDNLVIIKNVNLYQIYDYTFDITHLDNQVIRIAKNGNDSLHLNDSLRKVPGYGMPIFRNDKKYGDLYVRFNIVIPKTIEPKLLLKLKDIFDEPGTPLSENYNKICELENVSDTELEDFESDSESSGSESSETDSESDVSVSSGSDAPRDKYRYKR